MRKRFVRRFLCRAFLVVCPYQVVSAQSLTDDQLRGEVSHLLEWKTFWEGRETLPGYEPRQTMEATVVSLKDQTAVFMGGIQTVIYFMLDGGQINSRAITRMSEPNTDSAVEKFLRDRSGKFGFVLKPGVNAQDSGPIRTVGEGEPSSKTHTLRLQLPAIDTPEYVVARKTPTSASTLTAAAREYISGFHERHCGSASVNIPFFSDKDPTVFVYAQLGDGCGSGIFPFKWGPHGWVPGQYSPDRPPNDWKYTIRKIREYTLVKLSLP